MQETLSGQSQCCWPGLKRSPGGQERRWSSPPAHCRKEEQEEGSVCRPGGHSTVRGWLRGSRSRSRNRSRRGGVLTAITTACLGESGLAGQVSNHSFPACGTVIGSTAQYGDSQPFFHKTMH